MDRFERFFIVGKLYLDSLISDFRKPLLSYLTSNCGKAILEHPKSKKWFSQKWLIGSFEYKPSKWSIVRQNTFWEKKNPQTLVIGQNRERMLSNHRK